MEWNEIKKKLQKKNLKIHHCSDDGDLIICTKCTHTHTQTKDCQWIAKKKIIIIGMWSSSFFFGSLHDDDDNVTIWIWRKTKRKREREREWHNALW